MNTLTEQERSAVTNACKYAMQDYGRVKSLPEPNIVSKELQTLCSALHEIIDPEESAHFKKMKRLITE